MIGALLPAVKDRLVLPLIVRPPKRESVLCPDNKGRPFAACRDEGFLKRMQFRRGHANIKPAFADGQHVDAGIVKKSLKPIAKVVIHNRAVVAAHLVLGRIAVVDIVGRIREHHVGQRTLKHALDVFKDRAVAAKQTMVAENINVARLGNGINGCFGNGVFVGVASGSIAFQKTGKFFVRETRKFQIKPIILQRIKFAAQDIIIPSGVECELVIRNDIGALIFFV